MTRAAAHPLGDIRHHFMLAQSMAHAVGADLNHAMHEGQITQEDWANTVTRCRGCGWAEACEHWVAVRRDGPVEVPGECANAAVFRTLAG